MGQGASFSRFVDVSGFRPRYGGGARVLYIAAREQLPAYLTSRVVPPASTDRNPNLNPNLSGGG